MGSPRKSRYSAGVLVPKMVEYLVEILYRRVVIESHGINVCKADRTALIAAICHIYGDRVTPRKRFVIVQVRQSMEQPELTGSCNRTVAVSIATYGNPSDTRDECPPAIDTVFDQVDFVISYFVAGISRLAALFAQTDFHLNLLYRLNRSDDWEAMRNPAYEGMPIYEQ